MVHRGGRRDGIKISNFKHQIPNKLQYSNSNVPPSGVLGLEFGIYLAPRFAGLDIGIWNFKFLFFLSVLRVLCGEIF